MNQLERCPLKWNKKINKSIFWAGWKTSIEQNRSNTLVHCDLYTSVLLQNTIIKAFAQLDISDSQNINLFEHY